MKTTKRRSLTTKSIALLLTMLMLMSAGIYAFATVVEGEVQGPVIDLDLTPDRLEALENVIAAGQMTGLIGFEGDYELPEGDAPVSVIVLFDHNPAPIQVLEAAVEGQLMALSAAEAIVEDEHETFRSELSSLFFSPLARGAASAYDIAVEYRHALNGVAITVPADMLEDVANISVVRAIVPDVAVDAPELDLVEDDANGEYFYVLGLNDDEPGAQPGRNPWGMLPGRTAMNTDELHERGITGAGTLVGVIDSGIDWMHPAFTGSFPSVEFMAQRGVELTQGELLNINVDAFGRYAGEPNYVFVGRDIIRLWPGGQGDDLRANPTRANEANVPMSVPGVFQFPQTLPAGMPGNNPMEVSPMYFPSRAGLPSWAPNVTLPGFSSHGTHVSGTIVGRSVLELPGGEFTNPAQAILGVAPEAYAIHYRGLYGWTPNSVIISAIEWAYLDRVDVVNMSLGGQLAAALPIQNIAINNIMLSDPNIVFVISAGNNSQVFYTGGNPGGASMAVTVSALVEPAPGLNLHSSVGAIANAEVAFMSPNVLTFLVDNETVPGKAIIDHPTLTALENGEYNVFAMPITSPQPAAPAGLADSAVGAGTAGDFAALTEIFGEESLAGSIVLIRRGEAFVDVAARANALGMGVIQITGVGQGFAAFATNTVMLSMEPAQGLALAAALASAENPADRHGTLHFTGFHSIGNRHVIGFSSTGPVEQSFEIKPEIGANGTAVFSANPRWTGAAGGAASWATNGWQTANANSQGTSMSAPHVAGGVALMRQFSNENDLEWTNEEIKTRMMNTAIPVTHFLANRAPGYGVFDGARQFDVLAAIDSETVVMVTYPHVPTQFFVPFENQPIQETGTGSFSFGGFNRVGSGAGERTGTLTATIYNNSDVPVTYNLSHYFLTATNARLTRNGGTLELSSEVITVAANSYQTFTATLTIPATSDTGEAAHGFYQGYVEVRAGDNLVARLPFAGVSHYRPAIISNVVAYRSVVTTNRETEQNVTSRELVVAFNATHGFYLDLYLLRYNEDITAENWQTEEFEDYLLGSTMGTAAHPENRARFFPGHRGINPDVPIRGVIFDGMYAPLRADSPGGAGEQRLLEEEGKFILVMDVFRQTPNMSTVPGGTAAHAQANNWFWQESILVPFYVDNTAPVLSDVMINGIISVDAETEVVEVPRTADEVLIEGNVSDLWIEQAAENEVTFDVFTNPAEAIVNIHNLMLLINDELVDFDDEGNFAHNIPADAEEVTITLVDGVAPVPVVNQSPIGTVNSGVAAFWNTPALARTLVPGLGLEIADTAGLRTDRLFGHAASNNPQVFNLNIAEFNRFALAGLNVTEISFEIEQTARGDLISLVTFANSLDRVEGGFTAVTWTRLASANIAANAVLNNPNATPAQVEAAVRNLNNMLRNLSPAVTLP